MSRGSAAPSPDAAAEPETAAAAEAGTEPAPWDSSQAALRRDAEVVVLVPPAVVPRVHMVTVGTLTEQYGHVYEARMQRKARRQE